MTDAKLHDEAIRLGCTISNCWRDDDAGVCRPVVNVNRNSDQYVWRFYDKNKPKTYLDALNSAIDEARKLWDVADGSNKKAEPPPTRQ